jgi:hypothetical protein
VLKELINEENKVSKINRTTTRHCIKSDDYAKECKCGGVPVGLLVINTNIYSGMQQIKELQPLCEYHFAKADKMDLELICTTQSCEGDCSHHLYGD